MKPCRLDLRLSEKRPGAGGARRRNRRRASPPILCLKVSICLERLQHRGRVGVTLRGVFCQQAVEQALQVRELAA
jgi:hypothetical protein